MKLKNKEYDVIIIGGGPAGLTAAYFLGKSGLRVVLFEKQREKGKLSHPCGAMVNPIKGHITFELQKEGVYYKEADFLFTNEMIIAHPKLMEFNVPNGCKFGMKITKPFEKTLIFQIDKEKVLKALAEKAEKADVELHYGARVSKLIKEDNYIQGVVVNGNEIRAKLVLSAEGLSRKFTNEAGLYSSDPIGYNFAVAKYLECLRFEEEELGQIAYFGSAFSEIPKVSLMFHTEGTNKIMVFLSAQLEEFGWPYEKPISNCFSDYIEKIDRIKQIFNMGKLTKTKGCWIILQKPSDLVTKGFVGMGDSVAPLGHASNSIAMLMGRDAADIAITSLEKSDVSYKALKKYNNKWMKSKLFKGIEFEANLILAMFNYTDEELNTLCDCFADINLEPFYIGSKWSMIWATFKLMFKWKILKNWKLVKRLF